MSVIVHVVGEETWAACEDREYYRTPSLDAEGFVHCSDPDQVVAVAEAHYAGRDDLLLLCIDPERLEPDVRYEALGEVDEPYPHVYGPVNTDAVVEVVPFPREADGFRVPGRVWDLA